jgi:uroporphyrinogen-III synthase
VSVDDSSRPAGADSHADSSGPHAQLKPVVVTRAESAEGPLSSQLRGLGLQVLLWPAVSVAVAETGPLEEALKSLGEFDWIVFASRHAVAAVTERVAKAPAALRVAAVGQATAQVLKQRGWPVHLVPDEANAAALVSAFAAEFVGGGVRALASGASTMPNAASAGAVKPKAGAARPAGASTPEPLAKVLFPASSRALPTIAAGLTQLGAQVVQVEAYRTEPASLDAENCRAWIAREAVGAVTFASPSAVIELERALGREHFARLLSSAKVVAIGQTTARELEERGCVPVIAQVATLRGLALTTYRLLQTRH